MHKLNRAKLLLGAPLLALLLTGAQAAQAGVLDKVKAHGSVRCGVAGDKPGFSLIDDKGRWTGMDVDLCRAGGCGQGRVPDHHRQKPLYRPGFRGDRYSVPCRFLDR